MDTPILPYFPLFCPKTGQKLRNFKENDENQAQNGLYLEENGAFEPKCPQIGEVQGGKFSQKMNFRLY